MRHLITTTALLALIGSSLASAQTASKPISSDAANTQQKREAPIGHRQPRWVPSEKNLSDPNNLVNKEDAALDRRLRSICRGC